MKKTKKRTPNIYKKVKFFIKYSSILLVMFFGWLQLDFSIEPLMTDEWADIVFKLALALYYTSWVFGTYADLKDEEFAIRTLPNKNRLPLQAVLMMLFLVIIFGFLCWANTEKLFIIALSALLVTNVIAWRYLVHFVKPTLDANKLKIRNSFEVEYQEVIEDYLLGQWQWYRFIIGFLMIAILFILIFTDLHNLLASRFNLHPQFIISLGLLSYVLIFEIWIWFKRLKRMIIFQVFDDLSDKYVLEFKPNVNHES